MFGARTSNDMISKIHERVLKLILNDHTSDFDTLLQTIMIFVITIEHPNSDGSD